MPNGFCRMSINLVHEVKMVDNSVNILTISTVQELNYFTYLTL